jgi:hypothetical protein
VLSRLRWGVAALVRGCTRACVARFVLRVYSHACGVIPRAIQRILPGDAISWTCPRRHSYVAARRRLLDYKYENRSKACDPDRLDGAVCHAQSFVLDVSARRSSERWSPSGAPGADDEPDYYQVLVKITREAE